MKRMSCGRKQSAPTWLRSAVVWLLAVVLLLSAAAPAYAATPSDTAVEAVHGEHALAPVAIEASALQEQQPIDSPYDTIDPAYTRGEPGHGHGENMTSLAPVSAWDSPAVQKQAEIQGEEIEHILYLPGVVGRGDTAINASAVQKQIDMKLLVVSADGNETDFPYVVAYLDQVGIPYDLIIATETQVTWDMLSNGFDHGYYQGVILLTGNLGYLNPVTEQWESAFDGNEWWTLWIYEAMFGVRQVTSYTYPGGWPESYGLSYVGYQDTSDAPLTGTLTPEGEEIFFDLNPDNPITFKNAWVYKGAMIDPENTTPLVMSSDGYPIASIHKYPNGRENLTITSANNAYLLHSLLMSYGTLNWVTKGMFLGERHVYMNPQIDDLFIDSDMWDMAAQSDQTGLLFRISDYDFLKAIDWQSNVRNAYPLASTLILEWAFNGEGTSGLYDPDPLTPAVIANQDTFAYVNHTLTHENLDNISYQNALGELSDNHAIATQLGLTKYVQHAMVQPDISGLYSAQFQRAAKDFGMKYLISDTSRPEWNNPSPNAGFYSTLEPSLFIIPRRPTNLFYNLSTPEEWVSEYNCFYGPTGTCADGQFRYWDRDLNIEEIVDYESDMWLQYLLKWDMDPLMFHQANVRAYDGENSLLGDLIEATLTKYSAHYSVPIQGRTQHEVGDLMTQRMAYNASEASATYIPCTSMTLTTANPAVIPLTGIAYGDSQEVYAGQTISYVELGAGESVTVPLPACE